MRKYQVNSKLIFLYECIKIGPQLLPLTPQSGPLLTIRYLLIKQLLILDYVYLLQNMLLPQHCPRLNHDG